MKRLDCRDAGLQCGAELAGATEEEVLEQAVRHAREDHGVDVTQAQTLIRYLRSAIRDEGAAPREAS